MTKLRTGRLFDPDANGEARASVVGRSARVNLSIPAELLDTVRAQAPGLNLSAVLRDALAAKLGCTHDDVVCAECATELDRLELIDGVLCRFYSDLQWEHSHAINAGGVLEGFGTVLKRVATTYGVSNVDRVPMARATRKQRRAKLDAKVSELPQRDRERDIA